MRYVLIILDKSERQWPADGGIRDAFSTKKAAVKAGREYIEDVEGEEVVGLAVQKVTHPRFALQESIGRGEVR